LNLLNATQAKKDRIQNILDRAFYGLKKAAARNDKNHMLAHSRPLHAFYEKFIFKLVPNWRILLIVTGGTNEVY
jgi:hypothetical protein